MIVKDHVIPREEPFSGDAPTLENEGADARSFTLKACRCMTDVCHCRHYTLGVKGREAVTRELLRAPGCPAPQVFSGALCGHTQRHAVSFGAHLDAREVALQHAFEIGVGEVPGIGFAVMAGVYVPCQLPQ